MNFTTLHIAPCIVEFTAFAVLALTGCAIVAAARLPLTRRSVLLAPALGIAATTAAGMTLDALGLPPHRYAAALVATLVLGSTIVLRKKFVPLVPALPHLPLAAVLAASLFITVPSFGYGFAWVGFANEDMTRTAMSAEYGRAHGLTAVAPKGDLIWNRNIAGSEAAASGTLQTGTTELMAIFMEVTGIGTFQAMMPVVVIAFMCMLAAMGAMMPSRVGDHWVSLAILGLATSGLIVYTTMNQGADELFGLALACGYAAILPALWRPRASHTWFIMAALILAGLFEIYIPLTIFAVMLTAAHAILHVRRRQIMPALRGAAVGAAASALFLNLYLQNVVVAAAAMAKSGSQPLRDSIRFVAFFVPSGVAYLWGLLPLYSFPPEPLMSALILCGLGLTALFVVLSLRGARRGNAPAMMAVIVLAFSLYFFARTADYALYKSTSYLQPFVICVAIAALERASRARAVRGARRWHLAAPLAACFVLSMWTSGFYLRRSLDAVGDADATFVNGRFMTTQRIIDRAGSAVRRSTADVIISNATQLNVQRVMADVVPRKSIFFPQSNYVEHRQPSLATEYLAWRPIGTIHIGQPGASDALFVVDDRPAAPRFRHSTRDYVMMGPRYGVFNRIAPWQQDPFFSLVHENAMTNALAFVNSTVGVSDPGDPNNTLSTLERDYFEPDDTYAGIGRYLVFEVLQPTKSLRLQVDFTAMGLDAVRPLPPVSIVGKRRFYFPIIGHGSARVLSPSVEPYMRRGHAFLVLDMGREGTLRGPVRDGLLSLFGRNLPLDPRRLVAYLRDLSAVSRPGPAVTALADVRRDLRSSGVLYSGIYDDGWLGSRSVLELSAPRSGQRLRLRGFVPAIDQRASFTTRLLVRVDGRVVDDQELLPGTFTAEPPDALRAGPHEIELEFSAVQTLPGGDRRPVGGALTSIGLYD